MSRQDRWLIMLAGLFVGLLVIGNVLAVKIIQVPLFGQMVSRRVGLRAHLCLHGCGGGNLGERADPLAGFCRVDHLHVIRVDGATSRLAACRSLLGRAEGVCRGARSQPSRHHRGNGGLSDQPISRCMGVPFLEAKDGFPPPVASE